MNREEYLTKRNELVAQSERFIQNGKLEEAEKAMQDIKDLDANFEASALAQANLNALKENQTFKDLPDQSLRNVNGEAIDVFNLENQTDSKQKIYENAWAKVMMGKSSGLSKEEKDVFDKTNTDFHNAYTHTTENTGILIPETVVAGIFKRAEEMYPFFGDAKKYNIKGKLTIKKHTSIEAGDANWYLESEVVADEQNTFGNLTLDGYELAKAITVSWKLKSMAVSEFIPYIINELGERVGVALGVAALKGTGTKQPFGVETVLAAEANTPQVASYAATGVTYKDITGMISKLHSSYLNGACFYANNTTIWTQLANIVDNSGKPIFIPDPTGGGIGRLFGIVVKADAGVSEGAILLGNAKSYIVNTNEQFSVVTEDHAKARATDYVIYGIVDGNVLDTKAFSLLTKTA